MPGRTARSFEHQQQVLHERKVQKKTPVLSLFLSFFLSTDSWHLTLTTQGGEKAGLVAWSEAEEDGVHMWMESRSVSDV